MRNYRLVFVSLLLSLVTLSAIAQENISLQGCRRGTPRPVHLRRGGSQGRTPGGDYYHGERHQLTVLVAFNDRSFTDDEVATMEKWDKIFNAENYIEGSFKGSVHDYFLAQSYGEFNIVFDLAYVQVSGNAKKYASTEEHDENSQYLISDIVDILKTRDIDWGLYDWNGDGYINQLLVVYPGHGMNDTHGTDLIWPHQWWMSEHLKDLQEDVHCDPIPVSAGDNNYLVDCYCAINELGQYENESTFGILCHEYSHCFGFPDFYYGTGTTTLGEWDLMDYALYSCNGFLPCGYSAHERWLMGWLTPIELTETTTITDMPALAEEGRAYLIRNDGCESEYYIVENRQPIGWDASLPGSGILVFHIDFDPSIWISTTTFTNSSSRKRYELFHANAMNSVYFNAGWPYPYQENDSLTNTSTPAATLNHENIDGTTFMSKPITNMAVTGGLASFDFAVTNTTGMDELTTGAAHQLLYRIGRIDIVRDAKGTVRKIIRK